MRLPNTQYELQELRSNESMQYGMHVGYEVAVGVQGVEVGETPFNASHHTIDAINPLSIMESATDMPHVTQVMPYRPIELNVVVHQSPDDRLMPKYLQPIRSHKRQLANGIREAISESQQVMDRTNLYVVGDASSLDELNDGAEVIEGTEDHSIASQAIASICLRGLTFVISDFNTLKLDIPGANYRETVAIKANHAFELAFPANVGRITLGGLKEVNTRKPKELAKVNQGLLQKHTSIANSLSDAGLAVAKVVYNDALPMGTNFDAADASIAAAIRDITRS